MVVDCQMSAVDLTDVCLKPAETERNGTDHLDLAGAPPHKPQGGDSSQTLTSSPEVKKKSRGFKRFLGRWVKMFSIFPKFRR